MAWFIGEVSQICESNAKNTTLRYILPNLCFALKMGAHFVIFPEKMLDNRVGVWYDT